MARKKLEPIETLGNDVDKLTVQKSRPLFALWRSDLTLSEFKILDTYLSRIDSHKPEKRMVTFSKGELEEKLGVTKINKPDLEKRLIHLMGNVVKVPDDEVKKGFKLVTLFEEAEAEEDELGFWTIKLECTQKAMKYFFNVEQLGYLRYKLRCITQLTSRYSYIMFMYLEDNRKRRMTWQVELEELKHVLNCEDEEYAKEYKYFNRDILKKVHKELTEKTECKYEYKPIKKGRKVVAVEFTLQSKALIQEVKPKKIEIVDDEIENIKTLTNNEFNEQQMNLLKTLLNHYTSDYNSKFDYLSIKYQEMCLYEPKNRFNYLIKMIKNDIDKAKNNDIIEGQTSIDDFIEDIEEPSRQITVEQEELNSLIEQLKNGKL